MYSKIKSIFKNCVYYFVFNEDRFLILIILSPLLAAFIVSFLWLQPLVLIFSLENWIFGTDLNPVKFPLWILFPFSSLSSAMFLVIDLLADLVGLFLPGCFVDLTNQVTYSVAHIWLKLFFDFLSMFGFSSLGEFILSGGPFPKSTFLLLPNVPLSLCEPFFSDRFHQIHSGGYDFAPYAALLSLLFFFLALVTIVLGILLSIAFLTVLERKFLGASQRREGPTQVGPFGFGQAIADAVKLLSKENLSPTSSNQLLFYLFPTLIFSISLLVWVSVPVLPDSAPLIEFNLMYLFWFASSTLHVYFLAFAAWSGTSRYSFTGSVRTIAQMLSYDVVLALSLAPAILLSGSTNPIEVVNYQANSTWLLFQAPISLALFAIVSIAETNRPPFDLPEAESELVAGSLTEYASTAFVFLFIAEYSHILLSCHLLVLTFLGGWHLPFFDLFLYLKQVGVPSFFIWTAAFSVYQTKLLLVMGLFFQTRTALPRYRYDHLMELACKRLLPIAIANLVLTAALVFLF